MNKDYKGGLGATQQQCNPSPLWDLGVTQQHN
jgi:hypothetical protein